MKLQKHEGNKTEIQKKQHLSNSTVTGKEAKHDKLTVVKTTQDTLLLISNSKGRTDSDVINSKNELTWWKLQRPAFAFCPLDVSHLMTNTLVLHRLQNPNRYY